MFRMFRPFLYNAVLVEQEKLDERASLVEQEPPDFARTASISDPDLASAASIVRVLELARDLSDLYRDIVARKSSETVL